MNFFYFPQLHSYILTGMFLMIILEFVFLQKKYPNWYNLKDSISNVTIFIIPIFTKKMMYLTNWMWFKDQYYFFYHIGLRLPSANLTWFWIFVAFIVQDFMFYWFHRVSHNSRWFWASHVTHHGSEYLNLSTGIRHNIFSPIIGINLFWLPLSLIGFNIQQIEMTAFLNITYQFFIHSRFTRKIPIYDYFFNTPSHHRVHHGKDPKFFNKNLGSVLIIWDRMFGTFMPEEPNIEFGLSKKTKYSNIFHTNFDEYIALWKDLVKAKSPQQLFKILFLKN